MLIDWSKYENFERHEFDSPDAEGSGDLMQPIFLDKLQQARKTAKVGFKINSGYRTESHNKRLKASKTSSHLNGWAADIKCESGGVRWGILNALIKAGFRRFGIGKYFIHVDCSPDKPAAIWHYYND